MGDACRLFNTPVTGGNVSFYNQSVYKDRTEPVFPTPTIGMLGLLDDYKQRLTLRFKNEGDHIYLIGQARSCMGSSQYLRFVYGVHHSPAPHFQIKEEQAVQQAVSALNKSKLLTSAHDVSEGGLFSCLLECAIASSWGFEVQTFGEIRRDAFLFGESQSRIVVTVQPDHQRAFEDILSKAKVPFHRLGTVGWRYCIYRWSRLWIAVFLAQPHKP